MDIVWRVLLVLVAVGLARPSLAQDRSDALLSGLPGMEAEIIVTAPGADDVDRFVGQVFVDAKGRQLSRWYRPVCVTLRGFLPDQEEMMFRRVEETAALVGVTSLRSGCKPNVIILLTDDSDALIERMLTRHKNIFAPARAKAVRAALAGAGPLRIWTHELTKAATGVDPTIFGHGRTPMINVGGSGVSRIAASTRAELWRTIIILDVSRMGGFSLESVSAHVAMRAMGRFDTDLSPDGLASILTLFHTPDGVVRPSTLTSWDKALLQGLYSSAADRSAQQQIRTIARHVARTGE